MNIAGHSILNQDSGGDLLLFSWHPLKCPTWHWAVTLTKQGGKPGRASSREGQWHDYYRLPFGYRLVVSYQDWHKR